MNWLEQYGKPVFDYRGSGNFYPDPWPSGDNLLATTFEVVQLSDGRIFCECKRPSAIHDLDELPDGSNLNGYTEYGYSINITNLIALSKTESFRLGQIILPCMVIGDVHVRTPNPISQGKPLKVYFYLTNFKYEKRWSVPLEWNLGKYTIAIEPLPNHDEIVKIINGTRKTSVTTKAVISDLYELNEIPKVVNLIDNLCALLSLAQGCHVRWICYEVIQETQVIEKHHRLVGPLSAKGSLLIPSYPKEDDIRDYIAQCLPSYEDKEATWRISLIISLYVEAVSQEVVENKGLKLAVLMDVIRGIYSGNEGKDRLIEEEVFTQISKELKGKLKSILLELLPTRENESEKEHTKRIDKIVTHVPIFQWYPFRTSLMSMRKNLRLNVSEGEIDRFIKQRDNLAHRYQFLNNNEQIEACDEMMAIVGKTILAILRYNGYYYDWTIPPNRYWTNRRVRNLYTR